MMEASHGDFGSRKTAPHPRCTLASVATWRYGDMAVPDSHHLRNHAQASEEGSEHPALTNRLVNYRNGSNTANCSARADRSNLPRGSEGDQY